MCQRLYIHKQAYHVNISDVCAVDPQHRACLTSYVYSTLVIQLLQQAGCIRAGQCVTTLYWSLGCAGCTLLDRGPAGIPLGLPIAYR